MNSYEKSDIILECVGVQKSYDGKNKVVKDLNLQIANGEFITLLGPSGSGKTTILMMVAGFETLTSGEIFLNGEPITRLSPQARNIGVVFQSYALFPYMTVAENIRFPLDARRMPKAEADAKVKDALAMVRLDAFGDRRPGQLSGGQQQRVALARALVFEPSLVLMDEPLGALDKQLREEMQLEIMHLQKQLGIAVIYVTHDQSEALTMSDRVAVFNDGVIQQLASPKELYERPATEFVASFIGVNNELRGTIGEIANDQCVVNINEDVQIKAVPVNVQSVGAATSLSIRPEKISIGDAANACENRFFGVIKESIYHGDHILLSVELWCSEDFQIRIPNGISVPELTVGSELEIGWRQIDCRALNAESDCI